MMDSYSTLIEEIRKCPGLFLGKKSLLYLKHFLAGYQMGEDVGIWETSTGRNYFENQNEANQSRTASTQGYDYTLESCQFNEFVYTHYNCTTEIEGVLLHSTMCVEYFILEKSNSDEEAFDKYFELRDAFIKQRKKEQI